MCKICGNRTHVNNNITTNAQFKIDPTQTKTIRRRYSADCYKRFRKLKGRIREGIIDLDIFGLTNRVMNKDLKANYDVPYQQFKFDTDAKKLDEFMSWLRNVERNELEILDNSDWQQKYIRSSYQKANESARNYLNQTGINTPSGGGSSIFAMPVHKDSVELLYSRNYKALDGITEAMNRDIGRELSKGFAQGKNPRQIASMLNKRVDKIGITRARTMARTEVVNAHAEATLNTYQQAGLKEVTAEVELSTAGDGRVCGICQGLEGQTYSIDGARGVIPVHPNCRCAWLPVVEKDGEKMKPGGRVKDGAAGTIGDFNNIKQADDYFKKEYDINIDMADEVVDNMDMNAFNEITKRFDELCKKYPKTANSIDNFTDMYSQKLKNWQKAVDEAEEELRETLFDGKTIRQYYKDRGATGDTLEKIVKRRKMDFDKKLQNTMPNKPNFDDMSFIGKFGDDAGAAGQYFPQNNSVTVNPDYFINPNKVEFGSSLVKDGMDYTLTHEFGHAYHYNNLAKINDIVEEAYQKYSKLSSREMYNQLTGYARTNNKEFVAESFVNDELNTDKPLANKIMGLIREGLQ
ncbi:MAG: minor capsid protein [Bacillota bacterium]